MCVHVYDLHPLELVTPADCYYIETNLAKGIAIEDHAPIKHERRLVHRVIHGAPVDVSELFPFSRNDNRLTLLRRRERCVCDRDLLLD